MLLQWLIIGIGHATPPIACGTAQHAPQFLLHRPSRVPPPPVPDLVDHETHGVIDHVQYSEQFALKWGPDADFTGEHAANVLAHFEDIYEAEVDGWGMASPTDGVRYFNVYVGDTGGVIPSAGGMAGYYTTDSDGHPMIVLGRDTVSDLSYARSVIAHEFFHAVQWASESFWVWETGGWFWEATATWAAGEVVPEHDTYWNALPSYALKPQVGLYHDTMDDYGGAPPDLHQYGAFIFARYISEILEQPDIILSAWRDGGTGDDPVAWLRVHMTDAQFGDALVGHAARNLTWDYADGERWSDWVDEVASWHPDQDDRVATLIEHATDDWYTVGAEDMPAAGGYNLIPIPDAMVEDGELVVAVRPDIESGMGTATQFRARVVSIRDGVPTRYVVDHTEPHTVLSVDPSAELWLVVAKLSLLADFPTGYKVAFFPQPDFPDEPEPDTAAPPHEDTGTATSHDSGGTETTDSGTTSAKEDSGAPTPSTPSAIDRFSTHGTEKSGCACTHTPHKSWPRIWLLVPLIALFRRDNSAS